jgi:hypothetical protein
LKCNRSKTVSGVFHDLKNVKNDQKSLKIGQVLPIFANFGQFQPIFMNFHHVLKKIGRARDGNLFSI